MRSLNSPLLILFITLGLLVSTPAWSEPFKIMVVMSYEQDNPWCNEIKEGIDGVLEEHAELTYFYMDTKTNLAGGPEKARQALALFERLQPNGVITVDDNAQSMFVVPFLKDKVDTPIFFCGANADAGDYGYPTRHISGTLERGHIRESIAFLKQLLAQLEQICFIAKASPSGEAPQRQVEEEQATYMARVERFDLIKSTREIKALGEIANKKCSAVYMDSLEGIVDEDARPLGNREILALFSAIYRGPIIGANRYHVEDGALSAVVKTGQEQGEIAAGMLLQALRGTPVSELPVTRNYQGRRFINVTTLEALRIRPRPIVLRGATLVRTPSPDNGS